MKKMIFLFLVAVSLSSCFDEATFKLADGQIVKVDQLSLDDYEVNQKVWLVRGYDSGASEWEILSELAIGQIGFEPEKDTVFVFNSQGGDYKRRIARGVLIKKN